MRVFLSFLFILTFLLSCNVNETNLPFWANVRFEAPLPENFDSETLSLRVTVFENEGGIKQRSKIWLSFKEQINERYEGVFLPLRSEIVGVLITEVNDSLYTFEGWWDEKTIDFSTKAVTNRGVVDISELESHRE